MFPVQSATKQQNVIMANTLIQPPQSSNGRLAMTKPSSIQNRTGGGPSFGQAMQSEVASQQQLTDILQKREISSTYIKRILDNQQLAK